MILVVVPKLIKILSFNTAQAMALYPFVLVSKKDVPFYLMNHEKIHHKQQVELLLAFFYLWYFLEFLVLFLKYKNRKMAYMNISFEREAYLNHEDIDYLHRRKAFSFLKYYSPLKAQD